MGCTGWGRAQAPPLGVGVGLNDTAAMARRPHQRPHTPPLPSLVWSPIFPNRPSPGPGWRGALGDDPPGLPLALPTSLGLAWEAGTSATAVLSYPPQGQDGQARWVMIQIGYILVGLLGILGVAVSGTWLVHIIIYMLPPVGGGELGGGGALLRCLCDWGGSSKGGGGMNWAGLGWAP